MPEAVAPAPEDLEPAQVRRLARGGVGGMAAAGVSGLSGVLFVVVVARGTSPTEAGALFALSSLFLMALAVVELGTDVSLVRFVALRLGAGDPGGAAAVLPVVALPVLVVASVAAAVLGRVGPGLAEQLVPAPGVGAAALVLAGLLPVAAASDLALAATRGLGSVRPTVLADGLLRQGSQPVLALAALQWTDGLPWLAAAWAGPYLLSLPVALVWLARMARRRQTTRPRGLRSTAREVWRFSAPRSVTQVAQTAVRRADIPLLAALAGPAAAALYTASSRFVTVGQLAIKGIQQMVGPQVARLLGQDRRAAALTTLRTATCWNVTIAWPVYLAGIAVPELVLRVFGSGYAEGVDVFVVLALAMLVGTGAGPVDIVLLMTGRSVASLLNNLAALATNLVLLLVLVPSYGALGAAVAWAAAIVVGNALPGWQVRGELGGGAVDRAVLTAGATALATLGAPAAIAWAAGAPPSVRAGVLAAGLVAQAVLLVRWRDRLRLPELVGSFRRRARPAR